MVKRFNFLLTLLSKSMVGLEWKRILHFTLSVLSAHL